MILSIDSITNQGVSISAVYLHNQNVVCEETVLFGGKTITIPKGSVLKCVDADYISSESSISLKINISINIIIL